MGLGAIPARLAAAFDGSARGKASGSPYRAVHRPRWQHRGSGPGLAAGKPMRSLAQQTSRDAAAGSTPTERPAGNLTASARRITRNVWAGAHQRPYFFLPLPLALPFAPLP